MPMVVIFADFAFQAEEDNSSNDKRGAVITSQPKLIDERYSVFLSPHSMFYFNVLFP